MTTQVKTKTLWQIGKSGNGKREFARFGGWKPEFDYTVGSDADPINQPSIPSLLVAPGRKHKPSRAGKQLHATDKLNIRFKLNKDYSKSELKLFYDFFGSETDSLFIDSQKITELPGVGEGKLKQNEIPLPALSQGEHVLSITTAGGKDKAHWIDYLKLEGIAKDNQKTPTPVLSFDGASNYIQVDLSPLNPLNPEQFTVSLWAKVTGGQGTNRSPITSRMGEPCGGFMIYAGQDDKWQFWIGNGSNHVSLGGSEVVLNSWTHLAATYDGSEMHFYINGKESGSTKSKFVPNKACPLRIGAGNTEANPDDFFPGEITEVRIWNQARNAERIQASMSQRLDYVNKKEKSLVGYWMLNRGSEFTVCDSTSNDQYGVINRATWVTSEDLPIKPATPKQQFIYADNGLAMFDADKVLPAELQATTRWLANFHQSFKGLVGTVFHMGIREKEKTPLPYMPPNLTSLNPDKYSDEYFVERRLNGVNPGQLRRVENQDWDYIIKYDFSQIEKIDDFAIFSKVIEARFCLDGQRLNPHSIEYILYGETEKQEYKPADTEWEQAKKIFRTAELVYHESRCHLGRTHINIDQYAMALYRNVVNNPVKKLLEPHLEGVLNINQRGGTNIIGFKDIDGSNVDGMIPFTSAISLEGLNILLKEEISGLTYRNWSPREDTIPDYVENNYFDRAAITMWNILNEYVADFFAENQAAIQEYWSEIEGMSEDLSSHSILKPELGTLDIKTMDDLKQLCVYVIYTSSFYHSWVNMKQYEDGGDVEFGAMGLWDEVNPQKNLGEFKQQFARKAKQSAVLFNLTTVRYNLIMDVGSAELKNAIWKQRHLIEPGLTLDNLLMSISI